LSSEGQGKGKGEATFTGRAGGGKRRKEALGDQHHTGERERIHHQGLTRSQRKVRRGGPEPAFGLGLWKKEKRKEWRRRSEKGRGGVEKGSADLR